MSKTSRATIFSPDLENIYANGERGEQRTFSHIYRRYATFRPRLLRSSSALVIGTGPGSLISLGNV